LPKRSLKVDRNQKGCFGWISRMPEGSHKGTLLKSLHSMLDQRVSKLTLAQRMSLSWKLASSLSHLHTANWLHKSIHSGNVIFCSENQKFEFEHPILSRFEYSGPQNNITTSRSLDPRWDIYRWPKIQNEAPNAAGLRKRTTSIALVW
jgi:serine/threonine protein kinase